MTSSIIRSGCTEGSCSENKSKLQILEDVRGEWNSIWRDCIADKQRAEVIANKDYFLLFINRGTVIMATKDFKPLNLSDILCSHGIKDEKLNRAIADPSIGGYRKFSRIILNKQERISRKISSQATKQKKFKKNQPLKKGGRGWLNIQRHT